MRQGLLSPAIIATQKCKRALPKLEAEAFPGAELPDLAEI